MGMTLRRINEDVEHEGMVRVYGFLSEETILVTNPKVLAECLTIKGYEFTKTFQLKFQASRVIGVGLACSEGAEHKVWT